MAKLRRAVLRALAVASLGFPFRPAIAVETGTPVIVRLAVPFRPEGDAQEEVAIRVAQRRLLADLGAAAGQGGAYAGPGITGVKLYDGLPLLALTATPEAMERLRRHPLVESIENDGLSAPSR